MTIRNILILMGALLICSCATIPSGIMQDGKCLERGEFEIQGGIGMGSEAPEAIIQEEKGTDPDWQTEYNEFVILRVLSRFYGGVRFKAGITDWLNIGEEVYFSNGFEGNGFIVTSKTRVKLSPFPSESKFQIGILPTLGLSGTLRPGASEDTSEYAENVISFGGVSAECPFIISAHTNPHIAPYFGVNPGFMKMYINESSNSDSYGLPEEAMPLFLNFHLGMQIRGKNKLSIAPEFTGSFLYYNGDLLYKTLTFSVAGGVKFKSKRKQEEESKSLSKL